MTGDTSFVYLAATISSMQSSIDAHNANLLAQQSTIDAHNASLLVQQSSIDTHTANLSAQQNSIDSININLTVMSMATSEIVSELNTSINDLQSYADMTCVTHTICKRTLFTLKFFQPPSSPSLRVGPL